MSFTFVWGLFAAISSYFASSLLICASSHSDCSQIWTSAVVLWFCHPTNLSSFLRSAIESICLKVGCQSRCAAYCPPRLYLNQGYFAILFSIATQPVNRLLRSEQLVLASRTRRPFQFQFNFNNSPKWNWQCLIIVHLQRLQLIEYPQTYPCLDSSNCF